MTRERIIHGLYRGDSKAIKEAIKALEQEPCEDAISRADAIRVASGYCHPSNIAKELAKLPPVQPKYNASEWCHDCSEYDQNKHCCPRFNRVIRNAVEEVKKPKTGHWIEYTRVLAPEPINRWEQAWYCSECGYGNQECEDGSAWLEWKYCPNCGKRMIEPQESEDKE